MRKLFTLALLLGVASSLRAQIINAASCSSTDVQTAFNSVVNSTTTVNIPACSGGVGWATQVTLTVPSGNTNLSILGAGSLTTSGGSDQTVIVDNYNSNSSLLTITTNSTTSAKVRIAGITFKGGSGLLKFNGVIQVNGSSQNFRWDHSHFNIQSYSPQIDASAVRTNNCVWGVFDHNIFDMHGVGNGVQVWEGNCYGDTNGNGDGAWNHATDFGSAEYIYLETNTFNSDFHNGFINDCLIGGRIVARFNTINASTLQGHATGSTPDFRSCRAFEYYQNTLNQTFTGNPTNVALFITGGTGVVWGNTANPTGVDGSSTGYVNFISWVNDRYDGSSNYGPNMVPPPNGWGFCGTHQTGVASAWDGNTNSDGYPCIDQVGRGQGDLLSGNMPTKCNITQNPTCNIFTGQQAHQAQEPWYEWLDAWATPDTWGGSFTGIGDGTVNQIAINRDYYVSSNPGSGSNCSGFTGGTGVGCGARSSRPALCTTGVAWWSTDQGSWNTSGSGGQGVLDKCTSTNTWTNAFYVPYSYPHPLVSGGGGPTTFTLSISAVGGTVTGTNCTSGTKNSGTVIGSCTANPNPGFTFGGWSGTGSASGVSGTAPVTFTITSDSTLTATFNPIAGIPSALHGVFVPGGVIR
jgi:uncharacterized repeat protein (TIGR02543 family)